MSSNVGATSPSTPLLLFKLEPLGAFAITSGTLLVV